MARRHLRTFGGSEIKTTGDGLLASFDSPARALAWASAFRDGAASLGITIRVGMHTGECEIGEGDLSGAAVNIAARVMAEAGDGEVWASGIVRELAVGAGLSFRDRGARDLKGVGNVSLVELIG